MGVSTTGAWATNSEIGFIDKALWPKVLIHPKKDREGLLRGYLKGCIRRKEWGTIKKNKVVAHATVELIKLTGGEEYD